MVSKNPDTIVAISTPHGRGGIGVIRLSGLNSLSAAKKIFRRKDSSKGTGYISHKAYYGEIIDSRSNEKLDEAMMIFFKGPKSYTCEDIVELSLHGSPVVMEEVLKCLLEAGIRLAEPGEFTKRAYLNKRIDLIQAEAVSELINSKSILESKFAIKRISGEVSNYVKDIREKILELASEFEAEVDFPEENLDFEDSEIKKSKIEKIEQTLKRLIKTYEGSKTISKGINTAIVGLTNAGKSTLFNALLKRNRAITSNKPGTTRDYIYDEIEFKGIIFKLFDTAGLNFEVEDEIEKEGISKTFEIIDKSDLLLIVLEKGKSLEKEETEIIDRANGKDKIVVFNKMDLSDENSKFEGEYLEVSALTGQNLDRLEKRMVESFEKKIDHYREALTISSIRQKIDLEEALSKLIKAKDGLTDGASPEFIAFDLKASYASLSRFGGVDSSSLNDDILNNIFSNFCIGK